MPIISIIVPVYNVEKYLPKCIHSILKQTFTDYELILVNDGSTDQSGDICNQFAELDNRIIVIHKKNEGLSSARNAGIDIARGMFLSFVDSDDYIQEDMHEFLYSILIREDADLAMCSLYNCYYGKKIKKNPTYYNVVNTKDAIRILFESEFISVNSVGKLYKKSLFNKVRFPMGKQAEDAFVIVEILIQCQKIAISSEQKYYYWHRNNSITTKKFNKKDFDVIKAYIKNYKIIANKFPDLKTVAKMRICWAYFFVLDKMILIPSNDEIKVVRNFLIKHRIFILKNHSFTFMRKISMLALMCDYRLYQTLLVINNIKNRNLYK